MNLQNNHPEMKTVVETFVIEETAELIYDNEKLDKWNELVNTLELKGQSKIVKPEKSPIPFMHLKVSLQNVFETLCPRKVDVESYDVTPIPVEILELVALSKREGYFEKIQIWYDEKAPDPACVGVKIKQWYVPFENTYKYFPSKGEAEQFAVANGIKKTSVSDSWDKNYYLIGKWADVKQSFDELKSRAKQRYVEEQGDALRKEIKERQRKLDDLEISATEKFN